MTGLSEPFKLLLFPLLCQMEAVFWEWVVRGLWRFISEYCTLASGMRFQPILARKNDSKNQCS